MHSAKRCATRSNTPKGMDILLDLVSEANIYEKSHDKRSDVNIGVLTAVARYVGDMLKMLGLGEGSSLSASQEIGWGTADESAEAVNKEDLLMPYLQVLSNFRDAVRALARSSAPASEYLKLSDALRDNDLVDLGISLEDTEDGKALVKLVPAAQLQAARRRREAAAAEKAARKAQAAEQARLKRLENLEKGRTAPGEMFRTEEYSEWDERGLPVKDKEGSSWLRRGGRIWRRTLRSRRSCIGSFWRRRRRERSSRAFVIEIHAKSMHSAVQVHTADMKRFKSMCLPFERTKARRA